jgi:serine/threonine protein kinase/lipoprotein NlpI
MPNTFSEQEPVTSASQLDELIALMSARIEAGESIDLAALTVDCPALREQLEMLLPTLQAVVEFEQSCGLGETTDQLSQSQSHGKATADGQPAAGVLGDFRILRELGRGGMGVVYEAEQLSIGRRVALKVLPFAAMLDHQQLNRFKNEARAAGTLDHPNILAIYAVGCERGVHYYAMQLIEGRSLAEIIAALKPGRSRSAWETSPTSALPNVPVAADTAEGALSTIEVRNSAAFSSLPGFESREYFRTIARLGIQAAEALDHAHQSGILHRDIKPANLLLDDAGKLWITDFGLARIEADAGMTMTGDILGTLRYMSPEQALAKRVVVDHRSDIYSLGVTLYELLTLQPAFKGEDRHELLRQIAFDEPHKPRKVNARIPQDLETIILKAIEKNPTDRYVTCQDLADDLRRFQTDQTIKAKRPPLVQRARKWLRRNRQIGVAIASLLVAVFIFVGFNLRNVYQERIQLERSVAEALGAGQAFLQTGDYDTAVERLSVAASRIGTATAIDPVLVATLMSMLDHATEKKLARERFNEFQSLREQAHEYIRFPSHERKAIAHLEKALNLYVVQEPGEWQRLPSFTNLEPIQQEQLPEHSAELLYLSARAHLELFNTGPNLSRDTAYRRAIDALRRIERVYHPVPAAYMTIADLWQSLGKKDLASAACQQANSLESSTAVDYFLLGERYYDKREFEDALQCYAMALQKEPGHYLSMLATGRTLSWLHREEAAEAMFTAAIATSPSAPIPYFYRSLRRLHQNKLDLARSDVLQMSRGRNTKLLADTTLGVIHLQAGDAAQALEIFDAVLKKSSRSHWSYLNRAKAYMLLNERQKAIDDCSKVIEMAPEDLRLADSLDTREILMAAYLERASARFKLRDIDKSLVDLKDAATYWDARLLDGGETVRHQLGKQIEQVDRMLNEDPENDDFKRYRQSLAKLLDLKPSEADENN